MEGTAVQRRLTWLEAEVVRLIDETETARSIVMMVPGWPGHLPGQHVDIRLTAEDGYQAERSYSLAAPANGAEVVLTVELVPGGEVSPYLLEELRAGDVIELRGPIGGHFVWHGGLGGPLQLIAGGSGLVPLMAMIRALPDSVEPIPARLLASARSSDVLIYREELNRTTHAIVDITLTRSQPPGWTGFSRRVDREMVSATAWSPTDSPLVYVCGPTPFVETVAAHLVDLGHDPRSVKTERFGPTGG